MYPPNQLMSVEMPRPDGSLGLLYLAGALREVGIEADVLDVSVGTDEDSLEDTFYRSVLQPNGLIRVGMSWKRLEEHLGRKQYDLVGINANFTAQTNMAFKVAEIAKKVNPKTFVLAGGVNARNLWPRFLKNGNFDMVSLTEAEKTIVKLVYDGDRNDYVDGTVSFKNGEATVYPVKVTTIHDNLDDLPMPAFDKLPLDKYERIASPHGIDLTHGKNSRYAPLMTSRGCPFQCTYCHVSMERFNRGIAGNIGELRLKSVRRVLEEIDILQSLGVKKIWIEDDSLLAKKSRVQQIFSAITGRGLTIADVNGVNLVHLLTRIDGKLEPDREFMELLYGAGLQQIVFPIESGSQRILDTYATSKLNLDSMDVVKLMKVAREVGIVAPVNIMIGFPDETETEMQTSIDLAQRLIDVGATYVTFFLPIPFPGSQLYDMAIRDGHLSPDFDPDTMNWKNGVLENTTVPRERIIDIRDQAWKKVNPSEYIAKRIQQSIGARWQT